MAKSIKSISKEDYNLGDGVISNELLQTSAIMRIADATELMTKNYQSMQMELERYKKWYADERERVRSRDKRISSLRGQITKLKNKAGGFKQLTNG